MKIINKIKKFKLQSAFEFLVTYGWALLLIAIIVGLLFYFFKIPANSSSNTCNFQNIFLCNKIFASMNSSTNTLFLYIILINQQQYPIENAIIIANINNQNTTSTICTPSFINTGNYLYCNINTGLNVTPQSVLSGKLYLNFSNCGLVANYLSTKNCNGAPTQMVLGQFFVHTS
ncbi:MAG: hypothetical protein ACP5UN_02055 [Candidatus Micrarchaeia archaeon]